MACGLGRVVTLFGDPSGAAVSAGYPLGPRRSRTVSKHFTSSIRCRMLTILRALAILNKHAFTQRQRVAYEDELYSQRD